MELKLYVGNLSYDTSEEELKTLFSNAGKVNSVVLIKDRDTGQSKGFGFIEMGSQSEAEEAIKILNGKNVNNRQIKVNIARPPETRPSSGYGNRSNYSNPRDRNRRNKKGNDRRY